MDKDIQEMFRKKNKEILINNLILDVERNIDVMENTVNNIFDKEFDSALKNISSMYEDSYFDNALKKVDSILEEFKAKSLCSIRKLINNKKEKLLNVVQKLDFSDNEMNAYYEQVFGSTLDLVNYFESEEFYDLRKREIDKFNKYTVSKLSDDVANITNSRINDYITYRLFGKIEDRVKSELFIRDNSLKNKGIESYEKYQELEMKTTNR